MDIDTLYRDGLLNEIDRAFAQMVNRISEGDDPWVAVAAGLVSRSAANGDVCLDLDAITANGIPTADAGVQLPLPIPLKQWTARLLASSVVGCPFDNTPMILDSNRLYLQRYWNYEHGVAQAILDRCRQPPPAIDPAILKNAFASDVWQGDPDQRRAVNASMCQRFTVISGGPGTGKTTTVAQIILHLNRTAATGKVPRIELAAPTGKAAARMQEALDSGFEKLFHNPMADPIPGLRLEARTLHRLLGAVPGSIQCRHNRHHPIPADVVIVDEASMIDLALMAKLMEAVSSETRLILVGDKDQLASVEAGSVLGDICAGLPDSSKGKRRQTGPDGKENRLSNHIVILHKSYRFRAESGIDELGRAINGGDGRQALTLLDNSKMSHICLNPVSDIQGLEKALEKKVIDCIAPAFEIQDPQRALTQLNALKILSPVRKGPYGVIELNRMVESVLKRIGVIDTNIGRDALWYPGRPVIIQRNDYHQNLFNGDVGIAMPGQVRGIRRLDVMFPDGKGGIKTISQEQLPPHETVYAMTVHKSQGTEFNGVLLVLPDKDVPVVTRELIYTAVTRARHNVEIWGRRTIFLEGVRRRIQRASGLREALWDSDKISQLPSGSFSQAAPPKQLP